MSGYIEDLTTKEWAKKHTSAATAEVVEAYPNDSEARFIIDEIRVQGTVAGDLQILDDTAVAVDGYYWPFAANDEVVIKGPLKKLPKNRGFNYTTTGGGSHSIQIKYHKEYGPVN